MRTRPPMASDSSSLLRDGETCWKRSTAARAALLVDGKDYFGVLRQALLQAREQVLIGGWDFDSRIVLPPHRAVSADGEFATAPRELRELLGYLLRTRPGLQIHVVRWDYHWLYREDRETNTRERLEGVGVHFHEHDCHPVTGCVHHKVVVIDDALAFCGGIDLTHDRWDTCEHDADDPQRRDPQGRLYMPVHDTQLCVSGAVAAQLGAYLRSTWPTGAAAPDPPVSRGELWPEGLPVDFEDIPAAVCRTLPASNGTCGAREIEAFYLAAIAAARRCVYVENQYFTSARIAQAITAQCEREPQLQGLLVGMDRPKTQVELHTMGYGRQQFRAILDNAGVAPRMPLVAAMSGSSRINLHSKLAIFDDRWLTVGSANLNRRSMGFDIECNLVLEAATPAHCAQMQRVRNRLLAEHLDMHVGELESALDRHGIARLPAVRHARRHLSYLQPLQPRPIFGPVLAPLFDRDELWAPPLQPSARRATSFAPLLLLALVLLAALDRDFGRDGLASLDSIRPYVERVLNGSHR